MKTIEGAKSTESGRERASLAQLVAAANSGTAKEVAAKLETVVHDESLPAGLRHDAQARLAELARRFPYTLIDLPEAIARRQRVSETLRA